VPGCQSDNTKNAANTLLTFTIGLTESVYSIGLFSKLLPPPKTIGRLSESAVFYILLQILLCIPLQAKSLIQMTQLNLLLLMDFELPDSFP